jgi:hypothetical protein
MVHYAQPSNVSSSTSATRDSTGQAGRPLLPWPDELLPLFSLRMSSHGMSISRIDMRNDARYALKQLHDARDMGDPTLALIAEELFRFFEAHQSGLAGRTH